MSDRRVTKRSLQAVKAQEEDVSIILFPNGDI